MGGFLAAAADAFRWDIFFLCIITTVLLQILSNLANDYGDFVHGADNSQRQGPSRAVQSGSITLSQMKAAVVLFCFLSFSSGVFLLWVSFQTDWKAILSFLGVGVLSILAAIGYTVGKRPYGYIGLGDLSVLIFFGLVGVMGSYYLFTRKLTVYEMLPALSCGMFSIAVLNINNIRDIESDRSAGKFSLPVRMGRNNAVTYHWALILTGILAALVYTILKYQTPWQLLFLVTIPLFIKNGLAVAVKPPDQLDPCLKQMALSTLLFVITFGVGVLLSF